MRILQCRLGVVAITHSGVHAPASGAGSTEARAVSEPRESGSMEPLRFRSKSPGTRIAQLMTGTVMPLLGWRCPHSLPIPPRWCDCGVLAIVATEMGSFCQNFRGPNGSNPAMHFWMIRCIFKLLSRTQNGAKRRAVPADLGPWWMAGQTSSAGPSPGGFGTKAHAIADARGRALGFALTPGQASVAPQSLDLLAFLPAVPGRVVADRGYSSHALRRAVRVAIAACRADAVLDCSLATACDPLRTPGRYPPGLPCSRLRFDLRPLPTTVLLGGLKLWFPGSRKPRPNPVLSLNLRSKDQSLLVPRPEPDFEEPTSRMLLAYNPNEGDQ